MKLEEALLKYDWARVLWVWQSLLGRDGLTVQALSSIVNRPSSEVILEGMTKGDDWWRVGKCMATGAFVRSLEDWGNFYVDGDSHGLRMEEKAEKEFPFPPFRSIRKGKGLTELVDVSIMELNWLKGSLNLEEFQKVKAMRPYWDPGVFISWSDTLNVKAKKGAPPVRVF